MPEDARDPRATITPDAFSVAPALLGTPLARPWRRGLAMAIDLILIAVFSAAGWLFLGLAAALALYRAAFRRSEGKLRLGVRKAAFALLGTATLLVTLAYSGCFNRFRPGAADLAGPLAGTLGGAPGESKVASAMGAMGDVVALTSAGDEAKVQDAATSFARRLNGLGTPPEQVMAILDSIAVSRDEPWARDAILRGLEAAGLEGAGSATGPLPVPGDPDSLAVAYVAALEAGDSATAAALRASLAEAIDGRRLARLRRQNRRLTSDNDRLEAELEKERNRGLIQLIFKMLDEIGIGFGWAALYFTVFPAFWRGRTPGKRVMGIRIVRLDGKPLGLWAAFNRFGGYAASIFTGLLGFFEMFWDDNRQALQDRIASTVVVRDHVPEAHSTNR